MALTDKTWLLGIVGTGLMGRGIAQIAAQAGIRVCLYDSRPGAAVEARELNRQMLEKLAAKGKLSAEELMRALDAVQVVEALEDLAPCRMVVEAVVENLEVKRELFRALEGVVTDDCLLATNTSSLSVTAIAAACRRPERVGGFHFFSPVPLMKIVEVIDGVRTEPRVGETLVELARYMGHTPVRAKDSPGFIVNHAGRGFGTEALRILSEGVADVVEIDRILREAGGFRMGPFELFDLTGLDVSHPVIESIYHQFYEEPRFRPSPLTGQRMVAGLLGRKSGQGFYRYADGGIVASPEPPQATERPARVWVSRRDETAGAAVESLVERLGGVLDHGPRPASDALCLVTPLGKDATCAALDEGLDPRRTLAIDTFLGLAQRRTLMATPLTTVEMRQGACGLLGSDGVPVSLINDSPGFVAQRVIALIVNIACDIAQQRIATPVDIDQAVTLGLGYPLGPLAWGDALGAERILAILREMNSYTGDPRYRPSLWLQRRARLGVSLCTPE